MPNIVQLWDFEDGTTQGWSLGQYTSLDDSGALQGTYSLKYSREAAGSVVYPNDLVASISDIDLSNTSRPMLLIVVRDRSNDGWANGPANLKLSIKDSSGTEIYSSTITLSHATYNWTRLAVFDLTPVAGQSGLTLEIYETGSISYYGEHSLVRTHYFDQIAIIDGADYEYSTGIVASDGDDFTVKILVPSSDGDLSSISVAKVGVALATPDWQYKNVSATAALNTASVGIDSSNSDTTHTNYTEPSTTPSTFQELDVRVWQWNVGAYAGWDEKVAVVMLGSDWSYQRIYLFDLYFTANGVSPRYLNVIHTTTYGTSVSATKDISVKIHGNSLQAALRAKYLSGDPSLVSSGSVTMTVYSSDKSTNYGSVSLDLTASSDQTSDYITNLPTDTDLVFEFSWSITANGRVVLLFYPVVKVA